MRGYEKLKQNIVNVSDDCILGLAYGNLCPSQIGLSELEGEECEPVEETVCKKCWKLALKYEYEEA